VNQFVIFDLVIAVTAIIAGPITFHRGRRWVATGVLTLGLLAAAMALGSTIPSSPQPLTTTTITGQAHITGQTTI
jgi:hypothetical protein